VLTAGQNSTSSITSISSISSISLISSISQYVRQIIDMALVKPGAAFDDLHKALQKYAD